MVKNSNGIIDNSFYQKLSWYFFDTRISIFDKSCYRDLDFNFSEKNMVQIVYKEENLYNLAIIC